MQLDKTRLKEEGYTGQELLDTSRITDLDRKCFAIKQVVADGVMSLEDAFALYGVSEQQYNQYLAQFFVSVFRASFTRNSALAMITGSIAVIGEMYKEFVANVDDDPKIVQDHLQDLSQKITSGQLLVK